MLIRMADGRTDFIDFREAAPAKASRDMYLDADGKPTRASLDGWRASGVPGTVRGFELASKKYGRKRWADLLAPGHWPRRQRLPAHTGAGRRSEAQRRAARAVRRFQAHLSEDAARFTMPASSCRSRNCAVTLERIARERRPGVSTKASIAHRLAAAMAGHGGLITLGDLKSYRAIERTPLEGKYRGYEILTAPPPSSGGVGILQMCGMLEGTGLRSSGAGSPGAIHWVAEAMRRFFADRREYLGDPGFARVPVHGPDRPGVHDRAAPDHRSGARHAERISSSRASPRATRAPQTTHYSIVDRGRKRRGRHVYPERRLRERRHRARARVPAEQRDGRFLRQARCAEFVRPACGGEANAIAPGKRPLSSMTPTIVLRDGKLVHGARARRAARASSPAVLQVILNVVDFRMNVQDAVDQPRFHHQWLPDTLYLEHGFSARDRTRRCAAAAYAVERRGSMARVAAILAEDGWLEARPDPRVEGKAAGY